MLKLRKNNTILFPAVLFCVFAFCSFFVLIYGIQAYQKMQDTSDREFQENTPIAYLINKVRAHDEVGNISVGVIQGIDCLVLQVDNGNEKYRNLIYVKDGQLSELLIPNERAVDFKEGSAIMKTERLTIKQEQNKLLFTIQVKHNEIQEHVYLRSY